MELMTRRNAVARAVLFWLYDEDHNYPLVEDFLGLPAAQVGDERVGNDELVRTVRWLDDRGLIDGLRIDQVPYPVKLRLTPSGRIVVMERDGWVQPEAASPAAPPAKPPVNVIAQAFLRWLYDHNREQPTPSKFLDDPQSTIGGHQVNQAEMVDAVELLDAKGLVQGTKSWQGSIPLRISLTDAGRICVIDHDADPRKVGPLRTWDEVSRGVPTIDKSVKVEGNGNLVVANSENVAQVQLTDRSRWPAFSVGLVGPAADGGHRIDFKMVRGPEQLHVTVGVAVLEPQEGVTASIADGETRRMVRDFLRDIVVVTEPSVSRKAVQIEIIATCVDVEPPHERWTLRSALMIPPPPRVGRAIIHR
jgi:hypothetical protein